MKITHPFGASPQIVLAVLPVAAAAVWLTRRYPDRLTIDVIPPAALHVIGGMLLAAGAALYGWSLAVLRRAVGDGRLARHGPYARVRHPIHLAWIALILPGVAMVARSWPLLAVPVCYALAFRLFIPREERALQARFGATWTAYRGRTRRLWPIRRRRDLS